MKTVLLTGAPGVVVGRLPHPTIYSSPHAATSPPTPGIERTYVGVGVEADFQRLEERRSAVMPGHDSGSGISCPHCQDLHPEHFSHCPTSGHPLTSGRGLIGRVVAGRYRVLNLIGEGGMGAVYVAEHLWIGRKVALKRLHTELLRDERAIARFQREARAAAATGHEHIVEVLDLGFSEDGAPFLVMEYVRGHSLAALIREEAPIAPERACRIVGQMVNALVAVHDKGIVHRDLKPDNILLTRRRGDPDFVKVVDFGISKIRKEENDPSMDLTRTGVMLGTPFYMSPEQARGMKNIDHRVDLFASGVILYETLSGRLPFEGENYHQLLQSILRGTHPTLASLRPDLDPALCAVVERAIALNPTHRFQSAAEMQDALTPFGAPPRSTGSPSLRPPVMTDTPQEAVGQKPTARFLDFGLSSSPATAPTVKAEAPHQQSVNKAEGKPSFRFSSTPIGLSAKQGATGPGIVSAAPRRDSALPSRDPARPSRAPALPSRDTPRSRKPSRVTTDRGVLSFPGEDSHGRAQSQVPHAGVATRLGQTEAPDLGRPCLAARPRHFTATPQRFVAQSPNFVDTLSGQEPEPWSRVSEGSGSYRPSSMHQADSRRSQTPSAANVIERRAIPPLAAAARHRGVSSGILEAHRSRPPARSLRSPSDAPMGASASSARVPGALKVPVGPGRVKGSLLLSAIESLPDNEADAEAIKALLPAGVRDRLDRVILPMGWIRLQDYDVFVKAADRELGHGDGSFAISLGKATADHELTTTHRLFMQAATPAVAAERIPQFFRTYHEDGLVSVERQSSGGHRIEIQRLSPDTLIHALVFAGFYERLIEMAGGLKVRANVVSCRERGDDITATTLRWQ